MKELTFETAKENKMSPIDCVRHYDKSLTDEQCDFILWNQTCFPLSTDIWLKQLYELFKK